ncbi:MAG: hypothetical protein IT437_14425 [Phycisphaerales bacterium]|nr:hypothetical protein [Phycisphaerales bacterium]
MLRRLVLAAFIGVVAALATGCGSRPGPVVEQADAYRGPSVSIDSTGPLHVIILTAPTAGWEVSFDQARQALGDTEVYVTARSPNPAYMYAQSQVAQRVGTSVDSKRPVRALVRVVPYGLAAKDFPYRVAAKE